MQPERVRQKKLERKRRKRETKRQALRLRSTVVASRPEVVFPFAAKMSDTLVDFAHPLVDRLPSDATAEDWELALMFASLVWNGVVNGGSVRERVLPKVRMTLDALGLPEDDAAVLLDALIQRKTQMFADDERLVVRVGVYLEDGMLRILAASAWS